MYLTRLFPKVLGTFYNENHSIKKKKLINCCYNIQKITKSGGDEWVSKSTYNTIGTKNLYDENDFKDLLTWIDNCIIEYCKSLNYTSNIISKSSWFNIYRKGDYQEYHNHIETDISCIYYLKGDEGSANTIFTDFDYLKHKIPVTKFTPDNSGCWTVDFKEGVLVVFKSDMLHCVEKHNLNNDRITIANNYKLGN